MNKKEALASFAERVDAIKEAGTLKPERVMSTPQGALVTADGKQIVNMCANNYLGLADDSELIAAAKSTMDEFGYGLSSVRFICGTQSLHKTLEKAVSDFLGTDDTILYSSCFDANGGLFESLLGADDAIVSDELNHASIIDGVRLCKAKRYRYKNNDMADLREKLAAARAENARIIVIATDGVFSMDGIIANLKGICDLADEFGALVMVDDSHAVGFVGENGRGTPEHCGVEGRVDILTGTFGKALGGASGGYTSGRKEIVDLLRQVSRPYLFSNTLAPAVAGGTLKTLEILKKSGAAREKLRSNTALFRSLMKEAGFDIIEGTHPIVPVMLYDERLAGEMAKKLYELGVYAVGFTYPVVPKGRARIRTQVSAAHTEEQLRFAAECFVKARDSVTK